MLKYKKNSVLNVLTKPMFATPVTNIHRVYINITVAALFVDIMYIKERKKNFQKDIKMAEKK